jgi:hypothetical protein
MSLIKRLCLVLAFASLSSVACAQTMFKCTQANGKIAYQAEPCPDNASEQVFKANKRGDLKVVQPATQRSVSDENVDAAQPTGARSSEDSVRSHAVTDPDPVVETNVAASADSAASSQASSPNSPPKAATGKFDFVIIAFVFLSLAASVFASIWLIIVAFGESVIWGLACIFIPLCGLLFVITHWDKAKKPFLISLSTAFAPILWLAVLDHGRGHHPAVSDAGAGKPGIHLAIDLVPPKPSFA